MWTPVLVLTAKDGEYDQADALDLGADDYLTAGDLTVDPDSRTVTRAGQDITVTPR